MSNCKKCELYYTSCIKLNADGVFNYLLKK